MSGPPPAVAAVRSAVRRVLSALPPGTTALVACSGGADSLALAGAVAFEAPRVGRAAGAVTVDHGLQEGSAERAGSVAKTLRGLGLDPVLTRGVEVSGGGGPEAAARRARYAALDAAVADHAPAVVLLGHTLDDQAETVLLGLARGSGARSLSGMAPRTGHYLRPFLELERATVRAACDRMGLEAWEDPHNADPRYARSRVRHEALPALERSLGPGVAAALARTAAMLRADADTLDALAGELHAEASRPSPATAQGDRFAEGVDLSQRRASGSGSFRWSSPSPSNGEPSAPERPASGLFSDGRGPAPALPDLAVEPLARAPASLRTRVLRRAALAAGCPASALTARHVREVDRLVTDWRGQSHIDLPGGVRARRAENRVRFDR